MSTKTLLGPTLFGAFLLSSCAPLLLEEVGVEVAVPEIPPAWDDLGTLEFRLSRSGGGAPLFREVQPGSRCRIELSRGERCAVFIEVSYRGRPLRPAGALWPDDLLLDGEARPLLRPDWRGGWTCAVFSRLLENGAGATVDFPRLARESRERSPDPWLVDPLTVADSLASRNFRSDMLSPGRTYYVALPPGGAWHAESPFVAIGDSFGESSSLPAGTHRFLSRGLELFVAIAEGGETVFLLRELE